MIIFGTKAKTKDISSGRFYCPKCRQNRGYTLKQSKKYFSLYFIPIIPMGDLGEFIECHTCGTTYKPEVLRMPKPKPHADVAQQLNIIKVRLAEGHPVEYMVRDLTAGGLEREVANSLVNTVAGNDRKLCPQCQLTYIDSVERCPECDRSLTWV